MFSEEQIRKPMSYREIGEKLGMKEWDIRKIERTALEKLRRHMELAELPYTKRR